MVGSFLRHDQESKRTCGGRQHRVWKNVLRNANRFSQSSRTQIVSV